MSDGSSRQLEWEAEGGDERGDIEDRHSGDGPGRCGTIEGDDLNPESPIEALRGDHFRSKSQPGLAWFDAGAGRVPGAAARGRPGCVLAALSSAMDGRYPRDWSKEERGRAVAQEVLEPQLSILLLTSAISSEAGHATGGAPAVSGVAKKRFYTTDT